jgi:hypothetical protein
MFGHAERHAVAMHFPKRSQPQEEYAPLRHRHRPPEQRRMRPQAIDNAPPVLPAGGEFRRFSPQPPEQRLGTNAARSGQPLQDQGLEISRGNR